MKKFQHAFERIEQEKYKRFNEGDLFGTYPDTFPVFILMLQSTCPSRFIIEARYSMELRVSLWINWDSYKKEVVMEIDRTKWTHYKQDFHIGHLKYRYADVGREYFERHFKKFTGLDYPVFETAVLNSKAYDETEDSKE